jgi:ribonuclease T1
MLRGVRLRGYVLGLTLLSVTGGAQAYLLPLQTSPSAAVISAAGLPSEGRETLRLIKQGGPFPYPRDGVVFGNRERQLPKQSRGYYHEYTVRTPGAHNRGARRIVCGSLPECYYTGDHYQTFQRIKESP